MKKEKKSPNKNQWQKIMLNINVFFVWLKKNKKIIYWVTFGLGLISFIYFQYYGLIHYHYPVPPGDDPMAHFQMADSLMTGQTTFTEVLKNGDYPPFYHWLVATVAKNFHMNLMQVILWTYPAILVLAAMAVFLLGYAVAGWRAGLLAFYFYAFVAKLPEKLLNDGGYPNLMGAHVLIPLAAASLIMFSKYFKDKKIEFKGFLWLALALMCGVLVILTHHISTFEILTVLGLFVPIAIIYRGLVLKKRWYKVLIFELGIIFIYGLFWYLFMHDNILPTAKKFLELMFRITPKFPYIAMAPKAQDGWSMINLGQYPEFISPYLTLIYVLSLTCVYFFWKNRNKTFVYFFFLIWSLTLLIGSRVNSFMNPERLIRDATVPMVMCEVVFILGLIEFLKKRRNILAIGVMICLVMFFAYKLKTNYQGCLAYNPMVRFTLADLQAVNYLNKLPGNKSVLANTTDVYMSYFLKNGTISEFWNWPEQEKTIMTRVNDEDFKNEIKQFDYLYAVDREVGWQPSGVDYNTVQNYSKSRYLILDSKFDLPEKKIFIFRIIK